MDSLNPGCDLRRRKKQNKPSKRTTTTIARGRTAAQKPRTHESEREVRLSPSQTAIVENVDDARNGDGGGVTERRGLREVTLRARPSPPPQASSQRGPAR